MPNETEAALTQMKAQLLDLTKELEKTFDTEKIKQFRAEITRLNEQIKNTSTVSATVKERLSTLGTVAKNTATVAAAAFASLTAAITKTVEVADPAVFQHFALAGRDLAGVIGRILTPVLKQMTIAVRALADWIINLSPAAKTAVAALVTFATVLAGLIVVLGILGGALQGVATGVINVAFALGLAFPGYLAIIGAVAALAAVLTALITANSGLAGVMAFLKPLLDGVARAWEIFVDAVTPAIEVLKLFAEYIGPFLTDHLNDVGKVLSMVVDIFRELKPLITAVAAAVGVSLVAAFGALYLVVKGIAIVLEQIIKLMRFLRIMSPAAPTAPKTAEQSSVGAGGRNVTIMTGLDVQRQAIASALMHGEQDANRIAEMQRKLMIEELMKINKREGGGGSWDDDRERH